MTIDSSVFRATLGHYPTGVCIITTIDAAASPVGMVVGTFTSVSCDPPMIAFLPDRASASWGAIAPSGRFCVNMLAHDQDNLCRAFVGSQSERFASLVHHPSPSGLPVLDGVLGWIDCTIDAVHEAGDHFIVVGLVQEMAIERDVGPLVFHRGKFTQVAGLPLPLSA